jgi:hypothetical protein
MQSINEREDEYEDGEDGEDGEDKYDLELSSMELKQEEEDEDKREVKEYVATSGRAIWLRFKDVNYVGVRCYAVCQLAFIGLCKLSLILVCLACLRLTWRSEECGRGAFLCVGISSMGLLVLEVAWNIPAVHIFPPHIDPLTKRIIPRLRRRLMRAMEIITWMFDWTMLFWTLGLTLEYDQCAADALLTVNAMNLLVLSFFLLHAMKNSFT